MPRVLAADDPPIAEHYREAKALGPRMEEATTEELRRGFVHYRSMFERLLGDTDDRAGDRDAMADRDSTAHRGTMADPDSTARRDDVVDLTDRQRADEARRTT